jgi:hypothetical protein
MGNPCWKKRLFAGRPITPPTQRAVKPQRHFPELARNMGGADLESHASREVLSFRVRH